MSLSRLAEKCQKCPFVSKCNNKRMEALGYLPDPIAAPATQLLTNDMAIPAAREIVTRQMYGQTYSMYKDELEKILYGELYKGLGLKYGG